MNEAAALPSPAVVLSVRLDRYYGRLRLPPGTLPTSRLHTGYRTEPSTPSQSASTERASPVPAATISTFRALYAGESFRGCASRLFTASMAFAVNGPARLSLNV